MDPTDVSKGRRFAGFEDLDRRLIILLNGEANVLAKHNRPQRQSRETLRA